MHRRLGKRIVTIDYGPEEGTYSAKLSEGYGRFRKLHQIGLLIDSSGSVKIGDGNAYPHKQCSSIAYYGDCTHMVELKDFFGYVCGSPLKSKVKSAKAVVKVRSNRAGEFVFKGTYTDDTRKKLRVDIYARREGCRYFVDAIKINGKAGKNMGMDFCDASLGREVKNFAGSDAYDTLIRAVLQSAGVVFTGDITGFFGEDRENFYNVVASEKPPEIVQNAINSCGILKKMRESMLKEKITSSTRPASPSV